MDINNTKKGTASVWAGEWETFYEGATTPPIVNSVTYGYHDLDEWHEVALGKKEGYIYSRNTNPTVKVFEEKVRALEHAESAIAFSTGMAAISNTLFALLSPGERVVSIKDTYGGTSRIFLEFLPKINVEVALVETGNHEAMESEIAKGCKLVYLETPTNPTLKVLDLKRLIKAAKAVGAIVVVDNTFATPINQNPITLGADMVVHSATKFLCGHSDAMGGIACGNSAWIKKVFQYREINGASLHPMSAYMIARGMKTLEVRVQRQNENAMAIAQFLKAHPLVEDVFYPGLPTHQGHGFAKGQMSGFGGMMSFALQGGYDQVKKFLPRLKLAHLAASLGSVSSLAGPPRTTSHVELTASQREELGIPESLVRYSVGIENVEDLMEDLGQALDSLKS
ncbi:MAG: cystathionine gamma-synthase family protein [Cyclobacteriaceae bacterium]|nr:cystathionine gamma-synthase family protein [Cyclobacteriaceae bacterium]MCB0500512.1 cystathionine gamma-synthase family protein [Cyclobacteriaceae bacterium]MCB9238465.1 cystathionine gamma-synthase family protein [Flammeovirgaceae bacterium]MCO5271412.1 cystathionine gamma-synthase family protein [Cyclobacteriaceae bacterium]MCW5903591.1 cystathionine gamma-synthase family protein [Cyclobacteriaceae bacterium]